MGLCVCIRSSLYSVRFVQLLCCAHKRSVHRKKQHTSGINNSDFIVIGNFEVGINFRDWRVYEIGLIAIRDESPPLFCAGGAGRFGTWPLRCTPFRGVFNSVHSHFGTCPI